MIPKEISKHIIKPVLVDMGLYSPQAHNLIFGTGMVESRFKYIMQKGGGPAMGYFQMEPRTLNDIYLNYLNSRPERKAKLDKYKLRGMHGSVNLQWCAAYAVAACRLHYRRVKEALPTTLEGQAAYWKKYYNTKHGAGTVEKYLSAIKGVENCLIE